MCLYWNVEILYNYNKKQKNDVTFRSFFGERNFNIMKFAYLIMAHHRFDVLEVLLEELDDVRNNIFLHIDKKTTNYDKQELKNKVRYAELIFVDSIPVYWGDFSQICCVLNLLRYATRYEYHDYYHLMVGVEFPLKTQNKIHEFFEKNKGSEFIGYDFNDKRFCERVRYWYPFGKYARSKNKWQRFLYQRCVDILKIQKIVGVNRIKGKENYFRKGYANWSITDELARYILSNEKQIKKRYRLTYCADELFIHTLVFHSKFYEKVYNINDEYASVMRITTWEDCNNQFHMKDIPRILESGMLFARKFDDDEAVDIIRIIQEKMQKTKDER